MRTTTLFRLFILFVFLLLSSVSINAQKKGDMGLGLNLSVGVGDSYTNFGLGAKYQWNVTAPIRLEPSFNYYFKHDHRDMWDLNLNVHYLVPLQERFVIYPLLGVGVQHAKVSYRHDLWNENQSISTNKFAINVGAGIDYKLTKVILLNFEIKYKIVSHMNRALFTLGAVYKF